MIVNEDTNEIHVGTGRRVGTYLRAIRADAQDPRALRILAWARKLGSAIPALRRKLQKFRINRTRWYASGAKAIIVDACDPPDPESELAGVPATLAFEQWLGWVMLEDRQPKPPGRVGRPRNPEKYDHPRRRPGRPNKEVDEFDLPIEQPEDLPDQLPVESASVEMITESQTLNNDVQVFETRTLPKWVRALTRTTRAST